MNPLSHFINRDRYSKSDAYTAPPPSTPLTGGQGVFDRFTDIVTLGTAKPAAKAFQQTFMPTPEVAQQRWDKLRTIIPTSVATPEEAHQNLVGLGNRFTDIVTLGLVAPPAGGTILKYNNTPFTASKTMAVEVGTGRTAQGAGLNTTNANLEDHYFIQTPAKGWVDVGKYSPALETTGRMVSPFNNQTVTGFRQGIGRVGDTFGTIFGPPTQQFKETFLPTPEVAQQRRDALMNTLFGRRKI